MKVSVASHSLHRGGGSGHAATDELLPRIVFIKHNG